MRPESEIRAEFDSNAVLSSYPGAFDRRRGYIEGYRDAEKRFAEWVNKFTAAIQDRYYAIVTMDLETWDAMRKEFGT